jgi:hypothetical protein
MRKEGWTKDDIKSRSWLNDTNKYGQDLGYAYVVPMKLYDINKTKNIFINRKSGEVTITTCDLNGRNSHSTQPAYCSENGFRIGQS